MISDDTPVEAVIWGSWRGSGTAAGERGDLGVRGSPTGRVDHVRVIAEEDFGASGADELCVGRCERGGEA